MIKYAGTEKKAKQIAEGMAKQEPEYAKDVRIEQTSPTDSKLKFVIHNEKKEKRL